MQSSPKVLQEWSVHAEVTFSHGTQAAPAQKPTNDISVDCSWQKPTTSSNKSTTLQPCYGFQRGNILFTTTPPRPSHSSVSGQSRETQPAKSTQHPYDRRCKSTCSIVLANPGEQPQLFHYHCGDRACYHAKSPCSAGFSTIPENCEMCSNNQTSDCHSGKSNTFTTHFCTRVAERSVNKERQDAASQTDSGQIAKPDLLQDPDAALKKKKPSNRLSRSPARINGKSPLLQRRLSGASQATSSRSSTPEVDNIQQSCQGKPRTVHIDVYCTGSEDADASASSEADTTDESSPQTVFESEQIRVLHTKMGKFSLPKGLKQLPKRSESLKEKSKVNHCLEPKGYDSDDVLSSQYPSRFSSYTSLGESASVLESEKVSTLRDPSWSTISSCALSCDDKESAVSTSWKDVSTEIDSTVVSSSSFVNKFDPYLAQSDSFEYADMADRLRIKEKAMAWADEGSIQQNADIEKKHLHQQQKFKEFLCRHLGNGTFPLWKSQHSDDSEEEEDDDDTGDAWSFVGRGCCGTSLRRENTVKKVTKPSPPNEGADMKSLTLPSRINHIVCDAGSLSDSGPPSVSRFARRIAIGPFGSKPPTPPLLKVESSVVTPFTSVQGTGTDQLSKAQKFGTIVVALKKPGNHTGPSKNPDCSCAHCRSFYEETLYRGRARSVGAVNSLSQVGKLDINNVKNIFDDPTISDDKHADNDNAKSKHISVTEATCSSESEGTPV